MRLRNQPCQHLWGGPAEQAPSAVVRSQIAVALAACYAQPTARRACADTKPHRQHALAACAGDPGGAPVEELFAPPPLPSISVTHNRNLPSLLLRYGSQTFVFERLGMMSIIGLC